MSENKEKKETDSMELTKQEKKEQKKTDKLKAKEDKKQAKAEKSKTPMDPARKKKLVKRGIFGGIAGVVVLCIVVSNIASANAKPIVFTQQVTKGDIEQTLSTSGSVVSNDVKVYFAPVSLKVGTIDVTAGETVKKGEAVITYDATDLANEKRVAELKIQQQEGSYNSTVQKNNESLGDLSEANINLEVLEQQITDIDNYIKQLQQKVNDKKTALAHEGSLLQISLIDWADKPNSEEYQNLQKLIQTNSYEQVNNAEIRAWQDEINKYTEMLNNCKEYKAEMKSQKSAAEGTKLNAGSKAELEAVAEIESITSQETLEYIKQFENGVLADFDGVVTQMNIVEGKTTAIGEQLFKLESTEDVKVRISVTKYDLEKLKVGQEAVVTIAGTQYEGEVAKIDKMATQNASGAPVVNADIKVLNPDENIFLGVEAKIRINTGKAEQALVVPVGAVNTDKNGDFVYAVENGIIVKKMVQTGISSDVEIEIVEGLEEGTQILTEITTGIEEGMAVNAMSSDVLAAAMGEPVTDENTVAEE